MICLCKDWSENIAKVNAPLMLQAARSGFDASVRYDGKQFTHCPWCGNPLKESDRPGADSVLEGGNSPGVSVPASPDSPSSLTPLVSVEETTQDEE